MASSTKRFSRRTVAVISFGTLFAILAAVWVGVAMVLHNEALADMLALRPRVGSQNYELDLGGAVKRESIFVPAKDGSKLHAWMFTVPGATKVALVSHGNAGNNVNRLYLASALTRAGVNVVLYDYRGYGISTGHATLRHILEDGDTMYDYVKNELKYSTDQIVLYGESIGTAVTCHIAAHHQCAGVILQSAIASLPGAAKFVFFLLRAFPDFVFPAPHLNNLDLVAKLHCPILLLHGMKDVIVSSSNSQLLYSAALEPKTLVFLPACGHNDMGNQDSALYHAAIEKFVSNLK